MVPRCFGTADDPVELHAHLHAAARMAAGVVAEARAQIRKMDDAAQAHVELEARLGRIVDGQFRSDVGVHSFREILRLLESFPRWSRVDRWEESQDVFYYMPLDRVRMPALQSAQEPKRLLVRTTATPSPTGRGLKTTHVVKHRMHHVDLRLHLLDLVACVDNTLENSPAVPVDMRVVSSIEATVPIELVPLAVQPHLVRIKQRKRFFLSSVGMRQESFVFDLTRVFSGKTKSEAEARQRSGQVSSHEIECECLDPLAYLQACDGITTNADMCLALSLILKVQDFAAALNSGAPVTYLPLKSREDARHDDAEDM
jgi:hypothetical protein